MSRSRGRNRNVKDVKVSKKKEGRKKRLGGWDIKKGDTGARILSQRSEC